MTIGEQNSPDPEHDGQDRKAASGQVRERLASGIALAALWSLALLIILTL